MGKTFQFRRALKHDAKLRLALCGPSGSGKTYTLLKLAAGLGGPVAVVDTERGSASKYADIFEFEVMELASYDPLDLIAIIDQASQSGYRVLCIDSLSHFWMGKDGELDKVDRIAKRSQSNTSFLAWKQVTPIHNSLIDRIISAPLHVLVSLRVKTEWILEKDERTGKTAPRKVGLAPVMRDGIEYEFDVCGEMDQDNTLVITKSRCPRLTGAVFSKPGAEMADILKDWLVGAPREPEHGGQQSSHAARQPVVGPPANGGSNGTAPAPLALVHVWEQMTTSAGTIAQFEKLKEELLLVLGSTGASEYERVLQTFGVKNPSEFKSSRPARMCAKELFNCIERAKRLEERPKPKPIGATPSDVEAPLTECGYGD